MKIEAKASARSCRLYENKAYAPLEASSGGYYGYF